MHMLLPATPLRTRHREFPRLEYLWLDGNELSNLDFVVDNVTAKLRIAALNLQYNNLTTLELGKFSNLPMVQKLFLHGNMLTEVVSGALAPLESMYLLDLSGNRYVKDSSL